MLIVHVCSHAAIDAEHDDLFLLPNFTGLLIISLTACWRNRTICTFHSLRSTTIVMSDARAAMAPMAARVGRNKAAITPAVRGNSAMVWPPASLTMMRRTLPSWTSSLTLARMSSPLSLYSSVLGAGSVIGVASVLGICSFIPMLLLFVCKVVRWRGPVCSARQNRG